MTLLLPLTAGFAQSNVSMHGFVSQGYVIGFDNTYLAGDADKGTSEFNEMSFNFMVQPSDKLRIGMQLFARDVGQDGRHVVYIDWAFSDYRYNDHLGIRLGKIKNPAGFYNTSRDLDMLRTGVLLPQSVYSESLRDFNMAISGASLYGNYSIPVLGDLEYEIYYGAKNIPEPNNAFWGAIAKQLAEPISAGIAAGAAFAIVGNPAAGNVDSYIISNIGVTWPRSMGFKLVWSTPMPGLKVGLTWDDSKLDLVQDVTSFISVDVGAGLPFSLSQTNKVKTEVHIKDWKFYSAEYLLGDLKVAAEYATSTRVIGAFLNDEKVGDDSETTNVGYYGLVEYRLGNLSLGANYSVYYPDENDKEGKTLGTAYNGWAKNTSFAVGYNMSPNWLVKLETILGNGAAVTAGATTATKENWKALLLKTTVYF